MRHQAPPKCKCGHTWENHHHGCIMNPNYPTDAHDYGICSALGAQECERTEVNGNRIRENEPECLCGHYVNSETGFSLGDCPKLSSNNDLVKIRDKKG